MVRAGILEDFGALPSEANLASHGASNAQPRRVFFCRQVCESGRKAVDTYDLKKRRYLGPTSMDAELA